MKLTHIYHGRKLTEADLAQIKAAIEAFDSIDAMEPELRAIAEIEWPELLAAKTGPRPPTRTVQWPPRS